MWFVESPARQKKYHPPPFGRLMSKPSKRLAEADGQKSMSPAYPGFLLGLLVCSEDGGNVFCQDVWLPLNNAALQSILFIVTAMRT
jgi:hypothetical protein